MSAIATTAAACAGGEIHAIGITTGGKAFTFGVNYSGQLGVHMGIGVFGSQPVPQMVAIPPGVTALPLAAAGERYSAFRHPFSGNGTPPGKQMAASQLPTDYNVQHE